MARLILFDIDQTLVFCAGAGLRCMGKAILEITGVTFDTATVAPDGKTDPLILQEILAAANASNGPALSEEIWNRYADHLTAEMQIPDERRCLKPGVVEVLSALASTNGVYLGLLTGNLETTARIKLDPFGLNHYFSVGAYGSDALDRCALGAVALQRACQHFGIAFEPAHTWVIGDTCRDVATAKAVGARALGVATGRATCEDLLAGGADVVLPDLSDTARVLDILLRG